MAQPLDRQPAGSGPTPDRDAADAEQRCRDLSAIAHSEQSGILATRSEALRRRVLLLEACEQWARELGEIGLQAVTVEDPALARTVREAVARIDTTVSGLINRLGSQSTVPPIADEPAEDMRQITRDDPSHRAVRLLLRIDAAVVHLESR